MADTRGLEPWEVLIALYNRAMPKGYGHVVAAGAPPLTEDDAREIIKLHDEQKHPVGYLRGRVIKTFFDTVEKGFVDDLMYNRDNGPNAAQEAIDAYVEAHK